MRRVLLPSAAFVRALKRLAKVDPAVVAAVGRTTALPEADAFDPRLRTHKLKGALAGRWSCSAGYDLRIVFELVGSDASEAILLVSCGTHDAVY